LPRVGREERTQVARTVQERTYSLVEGMLRKHNLPTITLSIGIATCPGDAQTADGLIEAADQAMYMGKHDGGDQVHTFSESQRRTN
jgi:GGDEF domain-containing protein